MRALLFINGVPPTELPESDNYDLVACSDGAFHYLKEKGFPLERLTFISGDFDSHIGSDEQVFAHKFIHTPDQDKTDFQKALEILQTKEALEVDVFGASGGEMDHFLGNLSVAFHFKDALQIKFYDEFSEYYFTTKNTVLKGVKGRLISLYPFPVARKIVSRGVAWPLYSENLSITTRIGTRNIASEDDVFIEYESGDLVLFVGRDA